MGELWESERGRESREEEGRGGERRGWERRRESTVNMVKQSSNHPLNICPAKLFLMFLLKCEKFSIFHDLLNSSG